MKTTHEGHEIEFSHEQLKEEYIRLEKLFNVLFDELEICRQELKTLKGGITAKGRLKLTYVKRMD